MRKKFLILFFLLSVVLSSHALKIEIGNPSLRPFAVYIAPFPNLQSSGLHEMITANIKIVPGFEFLDSREAADFEVRFSEDEGTFSARVTNIKSGDYSIFKLKLRKADITANAYLLSDKIYEKITQSPGVFSTRLVFAMNWHGVRQIFTSDITGKKIQKLTSSKTDCVAPKISPDRRHIVYTQYSKYGGTALRVMDMETRLDDPVVQSASLNLAGGFTPGSSGFYFVSYDGRSSKIYEYTLRSKARKHIYTSHARVVSPQAGHKDGIISFVSDELGAPQVFALDLKDKTIKRLTLNHSYATSPSFAPSGDAFVYLAQTNTVNRLFIASTENGETSPLGGNDKNFEDPLWLGERFLAVHAASKDGSSLFLIDIPTQRFIRLLHMPALISYLSAG